MRQNDRANRERPHSLNVRPVLGRPILGRASGRATPLESGKLRLDEAHGAPSTASIAGVLNSRMISVLISADHTRRNFYQTGMFMRLNLEFCGTQDAAE